MTFKDEYDILNWIDENRSFFINHQANYFKLVFNELPLQTENISKLFINFETEKALEASLSHLENYFAIDAYGTFFRIALSMKYMEREYTLINKRLRLTRRYDFDFKKFLAYEKAYQDLLNYFK